ncbi:hypothetical protein [Nannocystis pusilla]
MLLAGMQAPVRDQFGAAQVLPGLTAALGRTGRSPAGSCSARSPSRG